VQNEDGTIRNFVTLCPLESVENTEARRDSRGTRNYTEFLNGKNSVTTLLRRPCLQRTYNRVCPEVEFPFQNFLYDNQNGSKH
jgi:hypothetical protein